VKFKKLLLLLLLVVSVTPFSFALSQEQIGSWNGTYTLLAPLGSLLSPTINISTEGGISSYFDALFRAGIAIATGLALIMVMYGGFLYTSTDAITGKSEGIKIIQQALLGLLLALTSVLILNQLNPALLRNDVRINSLAPLPGINGNGGIDLDGGGGNNGGNGENNGPSTTWDENGNYTGELIPGTNKFRLSNFTNPETNSYVNELIARHGLLNINPSDANRFFSNGNVTMEGWNSIIAGMVKLESSFKPETLYWEESMNKYSVGLLQLSTDDPEVRRRGYTQADLQDPYKNLDVGIEILARQLRNDGCISCRQPGGWRGGSAYWSTLR
jgi:hypothetical protein